MIWLYAGGGGGGEAGRPAFYRLAGEDLACDRPLAELAAFAAALPEEERDAAPQPPAAPDPADERIYRGPGWVGGRLETVECRLSPQGDYRLGLPAGGELWIAADGGQVTCTQPAADPALERAALLGPGLILALALRGVFCLHASAALRRGRGLLLLGESGQGKSTLAGWLGRQPGWQSAGDDILPVSGAQLCPRFPQLKLPALEQPGARLPEKLPLAALVFLEHGEGQVALERLSPMAAARGLIHQTAAARLFGPRLLQNHLAFCSGLGEGVAAYRMPYPHREGSLEQARVLLERI